MIEKEREEKALEDGGEGFPKPIELNESGVDKRAAFS